MKYKNVEVDNEDEKLLTLLEQQNEKYEIELEEQNERKAS
jgi:hypothetical protein